MAEGAVIDNVARERDQALHRLQVLAAEIRAHEQAVRHNIVSHWRPADERPYRRAKSLAAATMGAYGAYRGPPAGRARRRGLHPEGTGPHGPDARTARGSWDDPLGHPVRRHR